MPKAEIHVHLEGTLEADTIVQWAGEAGGELPRPVDRLFEFRGLPDLLRFLDWSCALADRSEQLASAARGFARRETAAGAGYADLIFNPTHWPAWRDRLPAFVDALDAGFREAEQDGLAEVGLCVSLLRGQTAEEAVHLVELLIEMRHARVVALSIDGDERAAGRTGSRFADAFRRAADSGLGRTAHAGESSGPEGVRDALELLGVERIDHGVRAVEDPALVRELADRGVPLDVCPRSNVTLGLYSDLESHPIDELRRAGVPVSVNTDDPALLRTDLVEEYLRAAQAFDWDEAVLAKVAGTSIDASFANDDTKRRLRDQLSAWTTG
jgi:adenosine deaminase